MAVQKLILAAVLFITVNLYAQQDLELDYETITQFLYEQVSDDTPGMAVGIIKDGEIIYEKYIGYANMEYQIKIDKDTRFNIASNAKQFTALCILKLRDEGKIRLDDDFRKYLPEYYPNIKEKITVSNLITHTSGVRDYCDLMALTGKSWWTQFIGNDDALELLQGQTDLNFKPGTAEIYSNSNYILLTEIVKKITGQEFSDYAKRMFEDFGMPNTLYLTEYSQIIPYRSRPYGNWGGWREEPAITEVHGDGALYTNLQDQLKWEQILQLNNGLYLPQKSLSESQTPLASSIDNGYGYGIFFDNYNGLDYIWHDGVTGAMRATFVRVPSENIAIVLMSNNRNAALDVLAWQILPGLLGLDEGATRYPGDPDTVENLASIQQVLGHYKNDDGTIISITEKDGALYREMSDRDPVKLLPEKGGLFEYETIKDLKMNFTNIGQAGQQFTIYLSSQRPNTYRKYSDLKSSNFDKNDLNARFYNAETGTEIVLKYVEGNTYSLTKNGRERKAQLIIEDYLTMNSYQIKVIRDDDNKVVGLNVANNRIRNVIFKRV